MFEGSRNHKTLCGDDIKLIAPHKLFTSDNFFFDVSEVYSMVINDNFKNPYTGQNIFLNDQLWRNFFSHSGLTEIQKSRLYDKFSLCFLDEDMKYFLDTKKEILHQIAISGLTIIYDNSKNFLDSGKQIFLLREIIDVRIKELRCIDTRDQKNPYYCKNNFGDIIDNIDTCVHDIGNSLLKFYVFYYILLNNGNIKDWIMIRNAILSEWINSKTLSMKIGKKYGISNGSYKTFFKNN